MNPSEVRVKTIGGEPSVKFMPNFDFESETQFNLLRPVSNFKLPNLSQIKVLFEPGKISLIGAIFYDTRHAPIRHVLGDDKYWNSLDSETRFGPGWDVYALGMEGPGIKSESNFDEVNREIYSTLEEYGIERYYDRLPFFVFLGQHKSRDGFFHHLCIPLNDTTPIDAFNSLRQIIRTTTAAIKKIEPQNYSQSEEIFYLVEEAFKNKATWKYLWNLFPVYKKIKSFLAI